VTDADTVSTVKAAIERRQWENMRHNSCAT
jgi:hypothetical protein